MMEFRPFFGEMTMATAAGVPAMGSVFATLPPPPVSAAPGDGYRAPGDAALSHRASVTRPRRRWTAQLCGGEA